MPTYTVREYLDMVLIYGECGQRARAAARVFHQRFPHRRPTHNVILDTVRRIELTGRVQPTPPVGRPRIATHEATSAAVLAFVGLHPHSSTRNVALHAAISQPSVVRILKRYHYHAYHVHLHQGLLQQDYARRMDFCNWMLPQLVANQDFLQSVLFTDEANFSRDGVVNIHNAHYWSPVNPHWLREARHQERWSVNVWCGVYNDTVVGPIFYDGALTARRYLELILQQVVTQFTEDLPLVQLAALWMQQDGAPPHFGRIVREWLDANFPERWIGRAGPVAWPPRSPDLTPLDFFVWGYVKTLVYETAPQNINDLQERICNACATVTPAMLRSVRTELHRRLQLCIDVGGGHIEHL